MTKLARAFAVATCAGLAATGCAPVVGAQGEPADTAGPWIGGRSVKGLGATLVPFNTHYAPGEKIGFLFYVSNVTRGHRERVICFDGRLVYLTHIRVCIVDGNGDFVLYPHADRCRLLAPPESAEAFVHLPPGHMYGTELAWGTREPAWKLSLAEPGTYEVYATFECSKEGVEWGLRAWTGVVRSNRVVITVDERTPVD